jgi:hypothetical protein
MVVIAVASAESGLRGGATNHNMDGSTDYGCYQVNAIHRNRVAGTLNAGTTLRRTQKWPTRSTQSRLVPMCSGPQDRIL